MKRAELLPICDLNFKQLKSSQYILQMAKPDYEYTIQDYEHYTRKACRLATERRQQTVMRAQAATQRWIILIVTPLKAYITSDLGRVVASYVPKRGRKRLPPYIRLSDEQVFGKIQGMCVFHNTEQDVVNEDVYVDGRLNGPVTKYRKKQMIDSCCIFNGEKVGPEICWYYDGKLKSYSTGTKARGYQVALSWYSGGQIQSENKYHDGQLHGVSRVWLSDGTLCHHCDYDHGRVVKDTLSDSDDESFFD